MNVIHFFYGSIDENGYKVHFLPKDFELYEKELSKRFQFFGGINKHKILNTYSTCFKVHDKYAIATYTIKGEDSFGRKDVLFARGVLLSLEQYQTMELSPFQLFPLVKINDIDIANLKENFPNIIDIEPQDNKTSFFETSESIKVDRISIKRLKQILPVLWSGEKIRLPFNEENIWLTQLAYTFSPRFIKRDFSHSTQTNSLSKALGFSLSLARNVKEQIPLENIPNYYLYEKYIDKVYASLLARNYRQFRELQVINSFEDLSLKKELLKLIGNLFIKKKKEQ